MQQSGIQTDSSRMPRNISVCPQKSLEEIQVQALCLYALCIMSNQVLKIEKAYELVEKVSKL